MLGPVRVLEWLPHVRGRVRISGQQSAVRACSLQASATAQCWGRRGRDMIDVDGDMGMPVVKDNESALEVDLDKDSDDEVCRRGGM
jgi:hypothetical protein